jgi:hypothetical protein
MLFFKSAFTLSALLALASAMTLERNGKAVWDLAANDHSRIAVPVHEEMSILIMSDAQASGARGTQALSYSGVHATVLIIW